MLSDTDLLHLIEQDEIGLSYTFLPDASGLFVRQPRELKPGTDLSAQTFLRDRFVRSRVALTLGPLVKPVAASRTVKKSIRFAGHNRIVDLRQCVDGWALLPLQSAVVCTNEHLKLPHDITAFIIGRVSSYNNGLVTTTSFLDSGWNGIVKLLLVNTSQRPVRLQLGMEVGRLFFERTPNASADTSAVGTQSVHYGLTWPRILDDRIDPFPQAPAPPGARLRLGMAATNDLLQRYAGVGLVALVLAGMFGAVRVYGDLQSALSQSDEIRQLSHRVSLAESRVPVSGTAQVTVPARSGDGELLVNMPNGVLYRGTNSTGLVMLRDGPQGASTTVAVEQGREGGVVLKISVHVPNVMNTDTNVTVTWCYLP